MAGVTLPVTRCAFPAEFTTCRRVRNPLQNSEHNSGRLGRTNRTLCYSEPLSFSHTQGLLHFLLPLSLVLLAFIFSKFLTIVAVAFTCPSCEQAVGAAGVLVQPTGVVIGSKFGWSQPQHHCCQYAGTVPYPRLLHILSYPSSHHLKDNYLFPCISRQQLFVNIGIGHAIST